MRGYAAIGLYHPKTRANVGGTLRAAFCFDAALVVVEGDRSHFNEGVGHCTNTLRSERHIPIVRTDDMHGAIPYGCVPVAVDLVDGATPLHAFQHPRNAFYVFGPEDGTLGGDILRRCRDKIMVPTRQCMNLAATVNVVLYDRLAKQKPSLALSSPHGRSQQ